MRQPACGEAGYYSLAAKRLRGIGDVVIPQSRG